MKLVKIYSPIINKGSDIPVRSPIINSLATANVEGDEVSLDANGNLTKFEGAKHKNGGIDVLLHPNEMIFSEHLKVPKKISELILQKKVSKKMSYADLASKFPTNPYNKTLDDYTKDEYAKESANVKLNNHNAKLQTIFAAQELEKKMKDKGSKANEMFKSGGLKKYQSGDYVYDPKNLFSFPKELTDKFEQQSDGTLMLPATGEFFIRTKNGKYIKTERKSLPEVQVTTRGNNTGKDFTSVNMIQGNSFQLPPKRTFNTSGNNNNQDFGTPLNDYYYDPVTGNKVEKKVKVSGTTDYNNLPFNKRGTSPVPSWLSNPQLESDMVAELTPEQSGLIKNADGTYSLPSAGKRAVSNSKTKKQRQAIKSGLPVLNQPDEEPVEPTDLGSGTVTERGFTPNENMVENATQTETGDLDTTLPGSSTEIKAKTKSRNWKDFIPGSKAAGTILDIGMALSDNLTVDEPNYRDNRKYPIFNRFVNFDDKEVGRSYAANAEAIQNSNVPESVKQAQLSSLNSKLQDYQAKIDFANAQRYENKLAGDNDKLQGYMDRNIDQATQDLDIYRQKKARVNELVDRFKAQRKSRVFNSLRNYADYAEETQQMNNFFENFSTSPWSGRTKYKGQSVNPFEDPELKMRQFASGQTGTPLGDSGARMFQLPNGKYVVIDKDNKVIKAD